MKVGELWVLKHPWSWNCCLTTNTIYYAKIIKIYQKDNDLDYKVLFWFGPLDYLEMNTMEMYTSMFLKEFERVRE